MPRNRTSPPPLLVAEDAHSRVGCYETDFPSPARGKQPVVQQLALHLRTAKQRQELGLRNGRHRRDRYQAWRGEGALPVNGMLSLCSPTWDEGGAPMIAASCKGASKRTAGRPGSTVHQRRRPFPRRLLLPLPERTKRREAQRGFGGKLKFPAPGAKRVRWAIYTRLDLLRWRFSDCNSPLHFSWAIHFVLWTAHID